MVVVSAVVLTVKCADLVCFSGLSTTDTVVFEVVLSMWERLKSDRARHGSLISSAWEDLGGPGGVLGWFR